MPEAKRNAKLGSHVKEDFSKVVKVFVGFIRNVMSVKGTDVAGTIDGIERDIVFRGHASWILIFSILIASIGLNVNSTPVIIGAMLISPLMGPILGIGLAIGTYDWDILTRSLKNFGIAIFISLLTSTIYFLISPLKEVQSELLARTKPTILDVSIAIFGGLAGILAGSRREKTNVIPGVAIATALMPPLCTAGFGLATGNWRFFFGAFYLFFLNSVFISVSTFFVVRMLHFPKKNFVNHARERQIKRYILIFSLIVILPSAKIFWNIIKETRFNAYTREFINDNVKFDGSEVIDHKIVFTDTLSVIELYLIGKEVPDEILVELNSKLTDYGLIAKKGFWNEYITAVTKKTVVRIYQAESNTEDINQRLSSLKTQVRIGIIEEIYQKNEKKISDQEEQIEFLEEELKRAIIANEKDTIPFYQVLSELTTLHNDILKIAYAPSIEATVDGKCDTISTFLIHWKRNVWQAKRKRKEKEIANFLKIRLHLDTLRVIRY